MQYKELKEIVNKRLVFTPDIIPQDAIRLASHLHIRVKNSVECREDCGEENYPLHNFNAVYGLHKGQHTIYYDEKYRYKNFAVAHEIAHHLLDHTSDGVKQHLDAQLMAAIIVAPSEYIHGIKSAQELAAKCKIPIDVAEDYWYELEESGEIEGIIDKKRKFSTPQITTSTIISASIIAVLLAVIGFMGFNQNNTDSTLQPTQAVSEGNITVPTYSDALEIDTVYVTPNGEKFHYKDCRHIQGADHIFEMTGYEAMQAGYEPCKDCIG